MRTAESKIALQRGSFSSHCTDCAERLKLIRAELLIDQGRSAAVEALLCKSMEPPLVNLDSKIKAKMFCGLAHYSLGQQQLSDQELPAAQSMAEASHSPLLADVLQIKGVIAIHRRQYPLAEQAFSESVRLARKTGDRELEASDLLDLGVVALDSERFGEALDWFNASTQIAQSIHAAALLETDLGNIGWAYYKLGDYEVALARTLQAEEQGKRLGAGLTPMVWFEHASLCRQQLGDLSGAEADYKQALGEAEGTGNKRLISGLYRSLSLVYLQQGRLDAAKQQANQALQTAGMSGDKSSELEAMFLQGLIEERQGNNAAATPMLMNAYRESAQSPSIRWQIESTLAAISDRARRLHEADTWYRKSIATFEAQRTSVSNEELRLPFFANGDELYRDYADFLIRSRKSGQALGLLDLGRARTLAEGLGRSTRPAGAAPKEVFDPSAVARNQNATILFYSLGDDKSWLWAIDAHRAQLFTLPKRSEIEGLATSYQKNILKPGDPLREQNLQARALYDTIVAPAAAMIPHGSRVILIPDGVLNQLNFETLLLAGKDGLHYWIEDVTITNANSVRLLSRSEMQKQDKSEKNILLMGDTVTKGTDFEQLTNAAGEVATIEGQFPEKDRMVLTQVNAVPAAYAASKPGRFSYIHFVAHGTASRLSPLDSAVILSPSPEHPDNYKLYARDIIHQPIHADLVTISACNGSGTRAYAGEGLVGLSWAFLRAGSHNVIGALWNVDDASALQMMNRLYSRLRSGDAPDVALRNAKLSLIHSDGIHRKPLYWAAFQIYAGS